MCACVCGIGGDFRTLALMGRTIISRESGIAGGALICTGARVAVKVTGYTGIQQNFFFVSAGVVILRYKDPERRRGFRVPFGPVIPVLSVLCCILLMAGLPARTWVRFFVWLAVGLVVYCFYSRKRSEFYKAS